MDVIRLNKLIIFPTDTVYGIGCSVYDKENIKKIYEIKHRPLNKPLAVLCYDLAQIEEIAHINDGARRLIEKFLPGALTIILKSKDNIKKSMNLDRVGVRIPNSKIALDILKEFGPMSTTSVNDSGKTPLNEYDEIYKKYNHLVDKIYKSDELSSNISSTVIMIEGNEVLLIREGEIKLSDILSVFNGNNEVEK